MKTTMKTIMKLWLAVLVFYAVAYHCKHNLDEETTTTDTTSEEVSYKHSVEPYIPSDDEMISAPTTWQWDGDPVYDTITPETLLRVERIDEDGTVHLKMAN